MIIQEDVPYTNEEVKAMVKTIHDLREQLKQHGWHPASETSDIKNGETIIILFRHPISGRLLPWETTYNGELPFDTEWWIRKPKEE